MAEKASLQDRLCAILRGYVSDPDAINDSNPLLLSMAVGEWVQSLRNAFYSPHRTAKDASVSRFLELETTLLETFERLSLEFDYAFWPFIVHTVVALSIEPIGESMAAHEASKSTANGSSLAESTQVPANPAPNGKRKTKAVRIRPKPNAPLAFVAISALKKLITTDGNHHLEAACHGQGRENVSLRTFCQNALCDPEHHQVDAKLLVEIVELFRVKPNDADQIRALADHLLATKNHSSLIKLCQTFESRVAWNFEEMIRQMIQSKDWGSAELMAKAFELDAEQKVLARALIDYAIHVQDFKRAHRIVHNFGLQLAYPDIEQLYSRDAVLKLIEKQKWSLALAYVGSDTTLQTVLLTHLVAAREYRHATHLARDRMGMVDFDVEVQASLATEGILGGSSSCSLATLPVHGYLELPLREDQIVFCETEDAVREAALHFEKLADHETDEKPMPVGLDVEWRPTSTKIASHTGAMTTTAVASILQIATSTRVFLIDLLSLHENEFLFDEFLLNLFTSAAFLKIGFGFDSDLKVLHQTFPERAAFRSVSPFLELSSVVQKACGVSVGNSLSSATGRILGRPLDKRMQLSNWDERPMSHSQVVYAALDAFCLLQITEHIQAHGLADDKATVTAWEDVESQMIGIVGLSSPVEDPALIADGVAARRRYQDDWNAKRHHLHGAIAVKDLLSTDHVQAYWGNKVVRFKEQNAASDLEAMRLEIVPLADLEPLLAIAEQEPSAYVAVNSICFFADEKPCVACIDSNSKLDTSRLAGLLGMSRRKIKLTTALECETIWGFSPGTVPPFAHRIQSQPPSESLSASQIPLFVDVTLRDFTQWVTGSGSHDQLLVLRSSAFFTLISVHTIADIALHRNGSRPPSLQHRRDHDSTSSRQEIQDTTLPPSTSEPNEYKFLADTMVGRVGRWLRTIGIDVVLYDVVAPTSHSSLDRKSALLALAAREQRIVLTRDKKLADRRDAGACFVVSSDDPQAQFQEIKTHFALTLKREEMMTRCAKCNHKGFQIVDREYVSTQMHDVVHARVLEVMTEFWKCLACHKLYWIGPKYSSAYENMLQKFENGQNMFSYENE